MKRLTALLGMGLLAACGQSGSNLSEVDNSLNVLDGNMPLLNEAALGLNSASNSALNEAEAEKIIVGGLPLRLGHYVTSNTACDEASNATVTTIRRDGYSGSRYSCSFGAIEKTGPTTYRVTESCTEAPGFGAREDVQVSVRTYDIPENGQFSAKSDNGWANDARFCPQASLPEPWRDEDLSVAIGLAPPVKP